MVTHEITLSLNVTPARVRLLLFLALCTLLPGVCSTADDVSSVDIYYPPPVAAVDQLQVAGQTVLARDYGNIYLGANNAGGSSLDVPAAYVAIGAGSSGSSVIPNPGRPDVRLYVNGVMDVEGCISLYGGSSVASAYRVWRCKFQ